MAIAMQAKKPDISITALHIVEQPPADFYNQALVDSTFREALREAANKSFEKLFSEFNISAVYTNHDYGPKANARDAAIEKMALKNKATYHHFKDQVIFEKDEVTKDDGKPYTIYTPYANKWRATWAVKTPKKFPSDKLLDYFLETKEFKLPTLKDMGFEKTDLEIPPMQYKTSVV